MKTIILLLAAMVLSACQTLPPQQCTAIANVGGQETTVPIYGVRKQANQAQYYAGNPFGWKWVPASNFTKSTCNK
ncbi:MULTISPECIES: phage exclusion lipoprotein Cor [unclassified Pantoea]|uniref:phage exclusion lipoprotein Cor n=1 Tax=unclassified Pantoea TaxID=2630326 RepID=UPI001CD3A0EA|nr:MULTISPECIES: cor protein [unclassified Pantoea]MCA1179950.1 cor protein [Pantoea sp. alder69]MCA1253979.1 cor protein [Pantoea sp. alder70]MCA1268436.1 cor protein [Pantoea sp. alder81]